MNNRKKLLIEPAFQISFLKFTGAILLVVGTIFYLATAFFFHNFRKLGAEMGMGADHIFFQFLETQETRMNAIVLISLVVTSAVFLLWSLYVSNKIAGPIYRLKKELSDHIENGTQKDIAFRKGDYFTELAELVNNALKKKH